MIVGYELCRPLQGSMSYRLVRKKQHDRQVVNPGSCREEGGGQEEERIILFQLEIRKEGRLSCRGKLEQLQGTGERDRSKEIECVPPPPGGWLECAPS